ncbi:acyl carrier protein [Slackia exigua]|uniref:acyl carrier protein n=1 Tax=Slackia exigua TaxID=84109 RepID=UPI00255073AA|nr:acyl carrier protein [Slackia exigua]MDK7723308.1 acyl carrier protein [Slackia exigua]MDK7725501.1 acyl carrier protein [Slackia exigua]
MEEITLDAVIEMLEDVKEGVDYRNATGLVDNREIDSFDILAIISAIDDEFDLSVPAKDIVPANFNSAQSLCALINRLAEEE